MSGSPPVNLSVVNFRPSYLMYADEVTAAVSGVLLTGRVLQGPYVRRCEEKIAELTGKRFALLFSSATTAIEAVMSSGPRDVVTPTINFVSVPYVARKLGRPVLLRPRTRPLSGRMAGAAGDDRELWHVPLAGQAGTEYARSVGSGDIEDASQCFMTSTPEGMVGTFGRAGIYSFTFNKFATAGEGGCVVTDSQELSEHLHRYRDFGKLPQLTGEPQKPISNIGYNYRISEVNAAMLAVQLDHAHETLARMRELHQKYVASLAAAGLDIVTDEYDNYTRVIIRVSDVPEARRRLLDYGIATPTPIMDYSMADVNGFSGTAEDGWDRLMCLPFWYGLSGEEITYVAESTARILG